MKSEVAVHLARADRMLSATADLLRLGYPEASVNRSYYACFHAATAVLLQMEIQRSSHHAVWAAFGHFVAAKGLIDPDQHRAGTRLFRFRLRADYLAEPEVDPAEAAQALEAARDFVAACRAFLEGGEDHEDS